jgi:RimJ/RimL family protein N-acetyltransferase
MERPPYRTLIPLFEELAGERIIVRPYRPDDAQALMEAVDESRDHLRPWMPFADEHRSMEECRHWIIRQNAEWLLRENMNCAILLKEGDRYLGGVGLHPINWDIRRFEIGYWLRKSAEGHGYMLEAVKLLADYALNELGANRVEIKCDERNTRSAAVAKRLGFVQEACLRNHEAATDGSLRNTLIFARIPGDP